MKQILIVASTLLLFACNGGKHDPEVKPRDSTLSNSNDTPGSPYRDKADTLYKDSAVRPDSSRN